MRLRHCSGSAVVQARPQWSGLCRACLLTLLATAAQPALPATLTWDGRGPDANWAALNGDVLGGAFGRTNWGKAFTVPRDGDSLVFAGNRRLAPDNDINNLTLNHLSFAEGAGAFALEGRAIGIHGNITNASSVRQTIDIAVTAGGATAQTWSGGAAGIRLLGTLSLRNDLTLSDRFELANGGSDLSFGGAKLTVRSGSTASVRNTVLNSGPSDVYPRATAVLALAGPDTRWTSTGTVSIGPTFDNLSGRVELSDRARADLGQLILSNLALHAAGGSTVAVGPGGIQGFGGKVTLVGSVLSANGAIDVPFGRFEVLEGSTLAAPSLIALTLSADRGQIQVAGNVQLADELELTHGSVLQAGGSMVFRGSAYSTVRLSDASQLRIAGALRLEQGSGAVLVLSGARLSTDSAMLDRTAVVLSGRDVVWANRGTITMQGGEHSLAVGEGAVLQARQLLLMDQGNELKLVGGTLDVGELRMAGTPLNWSNSRIRITDAAVTRLGFNLPASFSIDAGSALEIVDTLLVPTGTIVTMAGGSLTAGTVSLNGGRLLSTRGAVLDMNGIGHLRGMGTVSAAIAGGSGQRISADGKSAADVLRLGDAGSATGFHFGGTLQVGTTTVILDDANRAQLGTLTTLGAGGQLVAANGLELSTGDRLRADGAASVQGALRNNGQVQAPGGLLRLLGDVDGEGSFSGRLRFEAGFQPGAGARTVNFGSGDLAFGNDAVLTLQILGAGASQHDRLTGIHTLSLDGTLRLVLGAGFQPQVGQRFDLLDWTLLKGRFDAIDWTGATLGAGLSWDASSLYTDGTVGVLAAGPVPEPATALLWLAGLGGLVAARRELSRRS